MSTLNTQLGVVNEAAYGTPLTPTRFFEYNSESIALDQPRIESAGMRPSMFFDRVDRFQPYRKGAAGSIEFDVPTKGFGFWLQHLFGSVATAGPVDSNYTHTATVASLLGKFFTLQINRPFNPSGTAQAFTYEGGKVVGWEFSCDVDGVLVCKLDLDFEDENTSTALATASYPTDYRIFTFAGGSVTIGGSSVEVKSFKVAGTNGLNVDRRYMRAAGPLKKEPLATDRRAATFDLEADFSDLTQYNRFRDALAANTVAQIVATFNGPIAHAGATLPSLTFTLPACRFDKAAVNVSGPSELMQSISGVVLDPATGASPITCAYVTTDVTP